MKYLNVFIYLFVSLFTFSCSDNIKSANVDPKFLMLASTIGPIDAGIIGALEDAFEKETGIRVRHVGAGTGEALKMAKKGGFDLVIVHAKKQEEKFIEEGFGTERIPLMYNEFAIVGPKNDPAGIRGMKKATDALKAISGRNSLFITRGDKSGTHSAEMTLWESAGIKPAGKWYQKFDKGSEGNVPTLMHADKMKAYTVMDKASYYVIKNKIKLEVLVDKDNELLNKMSVIPVNPKKISGVNLAGVSAFVKWLTDPNKGQKVIGDFEKGKYPEPLFHPDSVEYRKIAK
jgi:tungstate transport system substrate-binding protein